MNETINRESQIAEAIKLAAKWLGTNDAASPMGAIEFHAVCMKDAADLIAEAILVLAEAIREGNASRREETK